MKKRIALILTLTMITFAIGCGGKQGETETPVAPSEEESDGEEEQSDMLWEIEPLEETVDLTIGTLSACGHSLPIYIADQKGWFAEAGLNVSWEVFANGPTMSEAMAADAWDCGTTGIGGVITATTGYGAIVLGVSTDDSKTHCAFARSDSPIVQAGKGNLEDYPEVYGDADSWRGAEIMLPKGTTAHYILCKTLEQFGLTDADVNIAAMDVSNANTAFLAGQGDVAGLWGSIIFAEDKADYTVVTGGELIDIGSVSNCVANPRSMESKGDAVLKWFECYEMAIQWINENPEETVEYYIQHLEEQGMETSYEVAEKEVAANRFITLEENHELFHTEENGMSKQESLIYNALAFFVEQGNYEPEALEELLNDHFPSDSVDELYAKHCQ